MPKRDLTGSTLRLGMLETVTVSTGGTMEGSTSSSKGFGPYCFSITFFVPTPKDQTEALEKILQRNK